MIEEKENIAATLARVLPQPLTLFGVPERGAATGAPAAVTEVALPPGWKIEELDSEKLLANPRRVKATFQFSDADSFTSYVNRHKKDGTVTWCTFNPQTFALAFAAIIDEHSPSAAGWRTHRATFSPDMSAEWKAWKGRNGAEKAFDQVDFAEWIEEHADDITTANGLPTSLQMLTMATEFHANEDRTLKSTVRLQSGGVRLTYIADPDAGTTEAMQMFDKFALGIPVFQGGSAWSLTARLKYRMHQGKVSFFYDLVRPDRVHEGAAKELIQQIRLAIGEVPLLMGIGT